MAERGLPGRRLNELLRHLTTALAASADDHITVGLGEVTSPDAESLRNFVALGLLEAAEPARSIICDGCERACSMTVDWSRGADGAGERAFIVCDKRQDIGRVPVEPADLARWRFPLRRVALRLAELLTPGALPRPVEPTGAWAFEPIRHNGQAVDAVLCRDPSVLAMHADLVVTLGPANAVPAIELVSLLRVSEGRLALDRTVLRRALNARLSDDRVACEIKTANGEIVLANHITGERRTLAAPDFNSTNDNLFEHLLAHPGEAFTRQALMQVLDRRDIKSLHKFPENLGFTGELRRLFFRVSANEISFQPVATIGQMALQRIDPKRL